MSTAADRIFFLIYNLLANKTPTLPLKLVTFLQRWF
jgi:hypothetical protein